MCIDSQHDVLDGFLLLIVILFLCFFFVFFLVFSSKAYFLYRWIFCFTHIEHKEQIEKAEEKERLQKEKEETEKKEAEEAQREKSKSMEEVPSQGQPMESENHDKIGLLENSPSDQVKLVLSDGWSVAHVNLCLCIYFMTSFIKSGKGMQLVYMGCKWEQTKLLFLQHINIFCRI